ncbi:MULTISPECIES: signal recognition particle-docking protein FtsY [Pseudomonas]|uniref:Signal recognition particle receptor FtsY n=1 Tax=Pseudomonas extremorientalis TaxID=169669 RepID=A0A1H0S910_9PSED|nr:MULTISPECIES: signal recognition particle-docking protein FtsY [Pseudomonas]KAB0518645.1 signal recognition particle-docking protein FtsY [Pseudomonas extremorientalis]OIN08395.1 signal recognition particle-docking protein FtsY [Pseudomonas extremorientalis]QZP21000.1 signal recognition particle-docking protein FtsY [Pseudomonas sp. DR208]UUN88477.1 signal recognition particle-docking protein FtsY [Pseudomonas extremorientalis]WLG56553.1 signal recognition particle-docking protein FtsY [Pse
MFGSNDDKKTPAAAGEKKGLFGWLRKKPQETVDEHPPVQPEPIPEPTVEAEPVAETPAPVVLPMAEPVLQPVVEAVPEPEPEPEHKPWLELPVAEEPVALVEDVQAEHIAPPIPAVAEVAVPAVVEPEPVVAPVETSKTGFFARLKQGLSKTSASIGEGMASLFLGKKVIDDELLEDIETRLLTADVGVEATAVIIQSLTQKVARKQLTDADALYKSLQAELAAMLKPVEAPLVITPKKPFVILVVGVNGAGKTTTIGKLAKKLQSEGKKVMLAAGDTFRAAAVEQLQVWGERNKIPVIAQHTGADSASVIFDAVQAAKARNIDVLIADTAGRLHTKDNLMEELKKVRRVIGKLDADAPHEVLLVLDAGTGQNAISQAKQFNQTVQLTGLALTKLDGTAKGGVIFALAKQFGLPIRYIGVGEGIDDLRTFEAEPFVQALFAERERS